MPCLLLVLKCLLAISVSQHSNIALLTFFFISSITYRWCAPKNTVLLKMMHFYFWQNIMPRSLEFSSEMMDPNQSFS